VAVVGPSGCGKSTLLRIAAGLIRPSDGQAEMDGQAITGPGPERSVVFQRDALFPWLSVARNVRFGLDEQGVPRAEADRRVDRWLDQVGLTAHRSALPRTLSGGMAQRAALARALAPEPRVLLLDEPFGALDRITRGQMQDLLAQVWAETRATLLLITHDVEEAVTLADRVLVMSDRPGRILDEITIPLPRPRHRETRLADDFIALRRRIEAMLETALA